MNIPVRKKLIEVALPLEAINEASVREGYIYRGNPSAIHKWWAQRPLAAARAVIFAQMVDDPSAWPDLFPTEKKQQQERQRLFRIIEEFVKWESTTNDDVIQTARDEIWRSWRRACAENVGHPHAKQMFDRDNLPAFHDPFAGGATLPMEAQRLGLEVYATDLNPVAVLINKAMIEIPPQFAGKAPVNPLARHDADLFVREWKAAEGLASDVLYYGNWMRDEASKTLAPLYPMTSVTEELVKTNPSLESDLGKDLPVIAWIWARTVKSPNPAFRDVDVPLASTFMVSTKKGKEVSVEPVVEGRSVKFRVVNGNPQGTKNGTKTAPGGGFECLLSQSPIPFDYVRTQALAGNLGYVLMAKVVIASSGRTYLSPEDIDTSIAMTAKPGWTPDIEFFPNALGFRVANYGMTRWSDLFTARQLTALDCLHQCLSNVEARAIEDGATPEYARAIKLYICMAINKHAMYGNTLVPWYSKEDRPSMLFGQQTVQMVWDFAEVNPLSEIGGSFMKSLQVVAGGLLGLPPQSKSGCARQADACKVDIGTSPVVSTDPPYYANVGYADLSDFFYVWLRHSMQHDYPELFSTIATPKQEELVATPHRHGGEGEAESFFLEGMTRALKSIAKSSHPGFPVTIYYAFKQSELKDKKVTSTGWETFLQAVISAGFTLTGTWPMRTERAGRMRDAGSNALASSIVLVCRHRDVTAATATRREFLSALEKELPFAIANLQRGNVAPVDLQQAAIGPGMGIFTRYASVLDANGSPLSVRDALALINQALDEVLAHQEGDFDSDTRWALAWFEQFGFLEGDYGIAETLSKAKNTSVEGIRLAGIGTHGKGKVRLFKPEELPADWNPDDDKRLTVWDMVHHLIRTLEQGEEVAAGLLAQLGTRADIARELAYRLYSICERKKRSADALRYNALVQSWPELIRLAQQTPKVDRSVQGGLFE